MRKSISEEVALIIESILELGGNLFEFIMKVLEISGVKYYPPRSKLNFMTFGEFIYIDMLYMAYQNTKNIDLLDKFCAVIYRIKRKDFDEKSKDDPRTELNEGMIDHYASIFKGVEGIVKTLILINWTLIRKWIETEYPEIFPKSKEGKPADANDGWLKIRDAMAENVVQLEQIDKCLLHDVLRKLNSQIIESKKQ